MNPNDQNLPSTKPSDENAPVVGGIDSQQSYPKGDELFVIQPTPKKPVDKKSVGLVITFSIVGIILLVVVLVFALVGSASGLADSYRRLASLQIHKIDQPLDDLEPGLVLSNRNIESPAKTIAASDQSQPDLDNVLFVGAWSERYTQTAQLQKSITAHYKTIQHYESDLKKLLAFDDMLTTIQQKEPNLAAAANPGDSLTIRSIAGSYQDFAKTIEQQSIPPQIRDIKEQLGEIYHNKSTIYVTWASLIEAGNMGGAPKAQNDLLLESGKAVVLTEDQNYVTLLKPAYDKLAMQHKLIKNQLAN